MKFLGARSGFAISLLIAGATTGIAAPRPITGAGFTYYALSLYWLPTLCLEAPGDDACKGPRRDGLVVRSLQPTLPFNSPVNCGGDDVISDDLVAQMSDLIPTRGLMEREWARYGSCSGLAPGPYFALLRKAYESVDIPPLSMLTFNPHPRPSDIVKLFRVRNPGLAQPAFSVTCTDSPARLREVRICLTKDLAAIYCAGEIIASACRSLNVELPLPR
jgi:ribonuclease T2